MTLTCTTCQCPLETDQAAIFGLDRGDGNLVFGWTCCHRPVGDAAVVLGSHACMTEWLTEHLEYSAVITTLLERRHDHQGK